MLADVAPSRVTEMQRSCKVNIYSYMKSLDDLGPDLFLVSRSYGWLWLAIKIVCTCIRDEKLVRKTLCFLVHLKTFKTKKSNFSVQIHLLFNL